MEIDRLNQVNCMGYAYHKLGLQVEDKFLPPEIGKIHENFEETSAELAEAIAVITTHEEAILNLVHIALFDSADRKYVTHRPYNGAEITRNSLLDFCSHYKGLSGFEFRFIKLKAK